jgi:hypothetical protein
MAAEPNLAGVARLLSVVAGAAVASWGLWGADQGSTQWSWLALGGALLVLGAISYLPMHALLPKKHQSVS